MFFLCVLLSAISHVLSNHSSGRLNNFIGTSWNTWALVYAIWAIYNIFFFHSFVALIVTMAISGVVMVYIRVTSSPLNRGDQIVERRRETEP